MIKVDKFMPMNKKSVYIKLINIVLIYYLDDKFTEND